MHSHTHSHTHTHAYAYAHTPRPRLRIHIHHGHPHGHPHNTHTWSATTTAVVRSRRFCSVPSATMIISQKKVSLICNFAPPLGHAEGGGGGLPPPDIREGVDALHQRQGHGTRCVSLLILVTPCELVTPLPVTMKSTGYQWVTP